MDLGISFSEPFILAFFVLRFRSDANESVFGLARRALGNVGWLVKDTKNAASEIIYIRTVDAINW
jgi:hypothetical protein